MKLGQCDRIIYTVARVYCRHTKHVNNNIDHVGA